MSSKRCQGSHSHSRAEVGVEESTTYQEWGIREVFLSVKAQLHKAETLSSPWYPCFGLGRGVSFNTYLLPSSGFLPAASHQHSSGRILFYVVMYNAGLAIQLEGYFYSHLEFNLNSYRLHEHSSSNLGEGATKVVCLS